MDMEGSNCKGSKRKEPFGWERALAWLTCTPPPHQGKTSGRWRVCGYLQHEQVGQNLNNVSTFHPLQITITDILSDSHTAPWTMTTIRVVSSCSLLASRRSRGTNTAPSPALSSLFILRFFKLARLSRSALPVSVCCVLFH